MPAKFARLQKRLVRLPESSTAVIVPSVSVHPDELRKVPSAMHFEQRLLFELQLLRRPGTHLVYVTSQAIDPAVVDYSIDLVDGLSRESARGRLALIDCGDDALVPLTAKLLRRPDVVERILAAVGEPACLITYNSTELERELALRLDMPVFGCDPELEPLGYKSSGRKLFRAAGVPVLPGYEDQHDPMAALARLKSENPGLEKAVVKRDDGFAGMGNVVFSYADPRRFSVGEFQGVVESYLPDCESPSAQLEIRPDGEVHLVSTHDQVLSGQSFVGCVFPAGDRYRKQVQEFALRTGQVLAAKGVLGPFSVDFVAAGDEVYAVEINLRMGGATAPFMFLNGLVDGEYDPATGNYLAPDGRPRYYVAGDRIGDDRFRALRLPDLVEIANRHHLHYDPATRTGAFYFALGALPDHGKLGVVAVGESRELARHCYDDLVAALRSA